MPETSAAAEDNAPFVYSYDDDGVDGVDDLAEDALEPPEPEPLSEEARAALDLEQRANDIFAQYLAAIAENKTDQNTGPP